MPQPLFTTVNGQMWQNYIPYVHCCSVIINIVRHCSLAGFIYSICFICSTFIAHILMISLLVSASMECVKSFVVIFSYYVRYWTLIRYLLKVTCFWFVFGSWWKIAVVCGMQTTHLRWTIPAGAQYWLAHTLFQVGYDVLSYCMEMEILQRILYLCYKFLISSCPLGR